MIIASTNFRADLKLYRFVGREERTHNKQIYVNLFCHRKDLFNLIVYIGGKKKLHKSAKPSAAIRSRVVARLPRV